MNRLPHHFELAFFDKQVQEVLREYRPSHDDLIRAGLVGADYHEAMAFPLIAFNRVNGLLTDHKYSRHTDVLHSFSESRLFVAKLLLVVTEYYEKPPDKVFLRLCDLDVSFYDADLARYRQNPNGRKPKIRNQTDWDMLAEAYNRKFPSVEKPTTANSLASQVSKFRRHMESTLQFWQDNFHSLSQLG